MAAVTPIPRLSLHDAESKLLGSHTVNAGKNVELRRAFSPPEGIWAEDVYVTQEVRILGKGGERGVLAQKVGEESVAYLSKKYSAGSKRDAKIVLKLYICDLSLGSKDARIYASEVGSGTIHLSIAWVLTMQDGSVVLDGGRLYDSSTHMYGIGDMLNVVDAQSTVRSMATGMCDAILESTKDIRSERSFCGCF